MERLTVVYFDQLSGASCTQKLVKIQVFDQLWGACNTQKLVKIHNNSLISYICQSVFSFQFKAKIFSCLTLKLSLRLAEMRGVCLTFFKPVCLCICLSFFFVLFSICLSPSIHVGINIQLLHEFFYGSMSFFPNPCSPNTCSPMHIF